MSIGSFCIVLHGHMPYVLRHGTWPHGEDWLYEAAAETYLPLLAVLDECAYLNGNPRLTFGMTPILLEQLADDYFKQGFRNYLDDRLERAKNDRHEFEQTGQKHMAYLATLWEQFYSKLSQQFKDINYDIPVAFKQQAQAGRIELLTSAATHGYMPLLLEDSSVRAQVRVGLNTSERILGFRPNGIWLPEGAYRPAGNWTPPISWGDIHPRTGIERIVSDEGLTHFFVDKHLVENASTNSSLHEPVWVMGQYNNSSPVAAFTRDSYICRQVWCGFVGYPADGLYLEFHKRHGNRRGLRYWKVTDCKSGLGEKQLYYPNDVPGKIYEHVCHFCDQVKRRLYDYHSQTGRQGIVVACFDAELFGHWWFEGPRFLRDVLLTLNADPDVELCTAEDYIRSRPPDKWVRLRSGSWGEGGDHRVWANHDLNWLWEMEYKCEAMFGKLTYHYPWRTQPDMRKILEKAARQLLLLQASDWPFVISRKQALHYGIKRFAQHVENFDILTDIVERLAEDPLYLHRLNDVQKCELKNIDLHDVVFPNIDLNWWNC